MLLTEKVMVNVCGNVFYYENLGYTIPKTLDNQGIYRVKRGTKIEVLVSDLPQNSTVRVDYECKNCNKTFNTKYSSFLNNKSRLCKSCSISKIASDKEMIKFRSGENHPRYNSNLTDAEREQGRHYPEYRIWRENIYNIGEYACQCCEDKRGGNLIAHHLDGWHWAKDIRFELSNGVSVCETCHSEFHDKYDYKNNTREQFIDFLIEKIQLREYRSEVSKVFDYI